MAKKEPGNFHFISRLLLHGRRENISNNRLNDMESGVFKQTNELKKDILQGVVAQNDAKDKESASTEKPHIAIIGMQENDENKVCVLCYTMETEGNTFYKLELCQHRFCSTCLVTYLINEINESRTDIECPQCPSAMHPNNIEHILKDFPQFKCKYEDFMIRRYLVSDPDSRWCPAPDCSYAVIATGCASCPEIHCEKPNCGISFCYHCKAEWHPNQTCDTARNLRQKVMRKSSTSYSDDSIRRDDIKPCPRCQILIVKMNDGSCNHMVCSVCGAEFCWLCMKEVSDLHYLSPSGCTFWGKKPWSRKKKIIWQIGTLVGAPVGIALLAGIAVPSMVIGIPVWVGRKLYERYKNKSKQRRNITVTVGVTTAILLSPLLAGFAIAIGIPILLFYVYGVVPVSLCRAGCGTPNDEYNFEDCSKENCSQPNSDGASLHQMETSLGISSARATSGSSLNDVAAIAKQTTVS